MTRKEAYAKLEQAYALLEEISLAANADGYAFSETEQRQIQTARQETSFALQNMEAVGV